MLAVHIDATTSTWPILIRPFKRRSGVGGALAEHNRNRAMIGAMIDAETPENAVGI